MRKPPSLRALFVLSIVVLASAAIQAVVPTAAAAAPAKPVVYLTFDDGPGPDTPAFLDLLARYRISGTFFVTGRSVAARPATARRIVADGHAIANHSFNHAKLTSLSDAGIRSELVRTNQLVRSTTGVTPTCYRPPYGATNARVHAQAVAAGLPNADWTTAGANGHWGLWDVDTNDWRLSLSSSGWSEAAMMRELNKASNGDTVLMHDGASRRPRGLRVLTSWLAANHDRFDFRVLPGCGGRLIEPALNADAPQHWHRFQIARLYRAYFDRQPDSQGWEYWNREYTRGSTMADISYSFAISSEFNKTSSLDDEEFVTFVYAQVLDRAPDPEGFAYWLRQLHAGTDRGEVVLYFSEGREFISRNLAVMTGACHRATVEDSYRCWAATLPTYHW